MIYFFHRYLRGHRDLEDAPVLGPAPHLCFAERREALEDGPEDVEWRYSLHQKPKGEMRGGGRTSTALLPELPAIWGFA
jgi:hypothetical protein